MVVLCKNNDSCIILGKWGRSCRTQMVHLKVVHVELEDLEKVSDLEGEKS